MTENKALTIPEFADEIGVSRFTVQKWVQAGKVKGSKKGPFPGKTSPILIPQSELVRVKKLIEDRQKELAAPRRTCDGKTGCSGDDFYFTRLRS